MRITLLMQNDSNLNNLSNDQQQISQVSQSIASGVKLSSPSDDPYAWSQAVNIQQGLREYNSVQSNITFATGWEQDTSSALSQLSNLVSQAKQVAISATSATGTSQSTAYSTQLNGILQQALSLANTQYNGQYIFSGTATDTTPFSMDSSGNVTYSGDSGSINLRTGISNGSGNNTSPINVTGSDVFTYTSGGNSLNVLNQIYQLQQAVSNGDSATITNSITTLGDAFTNINNQEQVVGTRLSELNTQQSAISVFQTNAQGNLSNLQDTDMASATTQLAQAQTAYQAALQVTSVIDKLNLASILGSSS